MTAIIKHHIDYEDYHCELNHQREIDADADAPVSSHDKQVLEAGLAFFTEFFWATDCSLEATRTQLIDYLNHIGVKTASGKQWSEKHLANFRYKMKKHQATINEMYPVDTADEPQPLSVSEVLARSSQWVSEANGKAVAGKPAAVDNITRRKNNLSADIDYNHKPETNRNRILADFNDYRATRYLQVAEDNIVSKKYQLVMLCKKYNQSSKDYNTMSNDIPLILLHPFSLF